MTTILSLLGSKLGKLVAGLVAALGLLVGVFQYGRKAQREKDRVGDLEDYIETKEKIDEVDRLDSDAAYERLRDNGWLR